MKDVKAKFWSKEGTCIDHCRLTHGIHCELEDGRTISHYQIKKQSCLDIVGRVRGGGPHPGPAIATAAAKAHVDFAKQQLAEAKSATSLKLKQLKKNKQAPSWEMSLAKDERMNRLQEAVLLREEQLREAKAVEEAGAKAARVNVERDEKRRKEAEAYAEVC